MKILNAVLTLAIVALIALQAIAGNWLNAAVFTVAASAVLYRINSPEVKAAGSLFANTLTDLIPDVYAALDVVSRELVGMIPSVSRDPRADRCAVNATLRSPVAPANTAAGNITAAMAIPSAADQTIGNKSFTIQKSRYAPFSWNGEEESAMDMGPGFLSLKQQQIAQAVRALVNEVENDLCDYAALGASRAYGTAGTTPFASTLGDSAQIKKILDDNGTPSSARSLIINTSAGAALRTLSQLTKANEAGTQMTLRDGELLNLHGFSVKESAQINGATAGTGTGYLINNGAGYAVGDTALTVDTGSGTILAGDVLTIGSHKYVVASALASNVVTIAAPGLQAVVADNTAITVNATSQRNLAFTQSAILLGTRLPALPSKGDLATDRETITDPRSGLSFELAYYPGYRMGVYHISIAWGVLVVKPEHVGILLG